MGISPIKKKAKIKYKAKIPNNIRCEERICEQRILHTLQLFTEQKPNEISSLENIVTLCIRRDIQTPRGEGFSQENCENL